MVVRVHNQNSSTVCHTTVPMKINTVFHFLSIMSNLQKMLKLVSAIARFVIFASFVLEGHLKTNNSSRGIKRRFHTVFWVNQLISISSIDRNAYFNFLLVGMLHGSTSFLECLEYYCNFLTGNVVWF